MIMYQDVSNMVKKIIIVETISKGEKSVYFFVICRRYARKFVFKYPEEWYEIQHPS